MPKIQTTIAYKMNGKTISSTAVAISHASWSWGAADLSTAERAIIAANAEGVILSWDGTTPTATLGLPLAAGESVAIVGNVNIQNLKFIRSGASDATITVILER